MRKLLLLLVAAVPLMFTPAALAADRADTTASCPAPEITHDYDTQRLAVHVSLPATGCPSREHSQFMVAAQITRFDGFGPTDRVERAVMCGPFLSRDDFGPEAPEHSYFCEVDVALDHPTVEAIAYEIDVAYPGEDSDRSTTVVLGCQSDGETAACDD